MKIGDSITLAKRGSFEEYVLQVLDATSQLFFLLESVEVTGARLSSGDKEFPIDEGFGPSVLSVGLNSFLSSDVVLESEQEVGISGRLAQLAYLGWVAAVDGAWEKYRPSPPYDGSLRHGREADLFGDLHKIRNDLLKNRGVAQAKNCGKCTVLDWFDEGEVIWLNLRHVLEFLHLLGGYQRSMLSEDGGFHVDWQARDKALRVRATTPEITSNRVFIEEIPKHKGEGFGLFISMIFADGLVWVVEVSRANTFNELVEEEALVREAPVDEYGAVIHPTLGRMDVPRTYMAAKDSILSGKMPLDPGSPWIRFRTVTNKL